MRSGFEPERGKIEFAALRPLSRKKLPETVRAPLLPERCSAVLRRRCRSHPSVVFVVSCELQSLLCDAIVLGP